MAFAVRTSATNSDDGQASAQRNSATTFLFNQQPVGLQFELKANRFRFTNIDLNRKLRALLPVFGRALNELMARSDDAASALALPQAE